MDFGSLLQAAQKNAKNNNITLENKKYYSTKFEPPKKETKEKKLSDNIRKFLAKRENEEKEKSSEAKRKYNELMSMRTDRDKNKIKKMLKVTKSANRSVLEDAVDERNTAVTMQGPEQPDEDDYGYVSLEASNLYKNMMEKYKAVPEEKKFSDSSGRRQSGRSDLSSTKDRVREAIIREREDEKLGRKRTHTSSSTRSSSTADDGDRERERHRSRKNLYNPQAEKDEQERHRREEEEQKRKARLKKAPPPALNFQTLLKLAEQKQHEPLEVEVVKSKVKEPERLLTSREKREIEEKKAYLAEKERRKNMPPPPPQSASASKSNDKRTVNGTAKPINKMAPNGRIPKLGGSESKPPAPSPSANRMSSDTRKPSSSHHSSVPKSSIAQPRDTSRPAARPLNGNSIPQKSAGHSALIKSSAKSQPIVNRKPEPKPASREIKSREQPSKEVQRSSKDLKSKPAMPSKTREFPPRDVVKTREFPPRDTAKTREFPPRDVGRSREFPPKDVYRNGNGVKRKQPPPPPPKRRIDDYDDEDDSEYDSEMDDFIDDDTEDNDYSKHIRDIFGYDKSRYARFEDEYDSDDMETSFAQQEREEFISKKIGLMEDLEDMRKEAEEKARKKKRRRL